MVDLIAQFPPASALVPWVVAVCALAGAGGYAAACAVRRRNLDRRISELARRVSREILNPTSDPAEAAARGESLDWLEGAAEEIARVFAEHRQKLRRADANYRALVEEIPAVIYLCEATPEARTHYISPQVEGLLGFELARWKDEPGLLRTLLHPDDRKHVEKEILRATGRKERYACEYRLKARDDRYIWCRDTGEIIFDHGAPKFIRGFLMDVTDRKDLEGQFLQAQKMDALGRLAGSVAHDFNNLLTVIAGYSQILLTTMPPESQERASVHEIHEASRRATSLTRQLLAFSRKQEATPTVFDINGAVTQMEKMLRRLIGEQHELKLKLHPGLLQIRADVGQIEQMIMNLVVNARDAMPKGGCVTIGTELFKEEEATRRRIPGVEAANLIHLYVTDTGVGMDEATLNRLFEPFFTTKEKGKGTGLGLSTVYAVIKQLGGGIDVESEPGRGTTFTLQLALAEDSTPRNGVPVHPQASGRCFRGGTILVVEDEAPVRAFVRRVLEGAGYIVLEACDGHEALAISERHAGDIDLLLTDSVMPHLSGPDLARRLTDARAKLKTLLMSGYSEHAIFETGSPVGALPLLEKPFSQESLLRKIELVLGETPATGS